MTPLPEPRTADDTRSPLGRALAHLVLDAWNGLADEERLLARLDMILAEAADAPLREALERRMASGGWDAKTKAAYEWGFTDCAALTATPAPAPLDVDLDDLRQKAEAASPGPWGHEPPNRERATIHHIIREHGDGPQVANVLLDDDAAYIAAVDPATILRLLARLTARAAATDPKEKQ